MPRAAHSFASRRVMPARPLLLAVYDAVRMPPWNESIEAMLMILPPRPACTRCFATACARKNGTLRLRFIAASQSSSLKVSASSRRMMPALEIGVQRVKFPARCRDAALGIRCAGARDADDVRTRLSESDRDALPQ